MRQVTWKKERVLEGLRSEAQSREFSRQYEVLKSHEPAIRRFAHLESLIGAVHDPRAATYDEKDAILHALILSVQQWPEISGCARTLLSLAMWPALEHSYYKLLPLSRHLPDLFAEIHWRFMEEVARHNPAKQSKIAVNLQLNVEKAVRRTVEREAKFHEINRVFAFLNGDLGQILEDPFRERVSKLREWAEGIPETLVRRGVGTPRRERKPRDLSEPDREVLEGALQDWVEAGVLSETDALLISKHDLQGVELQDIAHQMGLSSEALRGRYFRLKARLEARIKTQATVTR